MKRKINMDMGKSIKIVQSESGDWYGLYVDNKLFTQGHNITINDFVNLIRKYKQFKTVVHFVLPKEHMEWLGYKFPENWSDVNYKPENNKTVERMMLKGHIYLKNGKTVDFELEKDKFDSHLRTLIGKEFNFVNCGSVKVAKDQIAYIKFDSNPDK
jgi:hypothetical protein